MNKLSSSAILVAGAAWASSAALAGPIGVDGVLGAEWAGVSAVSVTHDTSAQINNFGTPGSTTQGASYSIRVRDDGQYYYVLLTITGDAGSSAGNFANLYFDTDPPAGNGSDVGFEVTNNRYFIAGGAGYFDATSYLTVDSTSNPGTIELAIANAFFTSAPEAGVTYPNGFPVATGNVTLRLSQSFGYSVAGGASYGADRLGTASVVTAAVPEPGSLGVVLLGLAALARGRRRA